MLLTDLPNEILFIIVESISPRKPKTIYSLIRTNRRFANLLIPRLRDFAASEEYRINTLLWAAATRDEKMVRQLVERGAGYAIVLRRHMPQQDVGPNKYTMSNEDAVQLVLEKGPNLIVSTRTPHSHGWESPGLQYALNRGYVTLSMLLLENGANIAGNRVLYCVAYSRNTPDRVVSKILELGADVNEVVNGVTPLYFAARNKQDRLVKTLLEHGAKGLSDALRGILVGDRVLVPVQEDGDSDEVDRQRMTRLLLKYSNSTFEDHQGNTGLHFAACIEDRELAEIQLRNGVKVDAQGYKRKTSLHLAASSGSAMVASLLLENNANMNASDINGLTPLHWAAKSGHSRVVRILVEAGANTDARDQSGNTPLHLATRYKCTAVFRLLLWKKVALDNVNDCGVTALHLAAKWGDVLMVRMLLKKGSDINIRDKEGKTPLLQAASYKHVATVKILLDNGAAITDRDNRGRGMPEWVVDEVLHHPERCIMDIPNISLVNRLQREKDKGTMYRFAREFWELRLC